MPVVGCYCLGACDWLFAAAAAAATAIVTEAVANPCPKEEDSLEVLFGKNYVYYDKILN